MLVELKQMMRSFYRRSGMMRGRRRGAVGAGVLLAASLYISLHWTGIFNVDPVPSVVFSIFTADTSLTMQQAPPQLLPVNDGQRFYSDNPQKEVLVHNNWSVRKEEQQQKQGESPTNFTSALLSHADGNGLIYLSSVDYAYLPMAINLHQTSFSQLNIYNYLFVCTDGKAFDALQHLGINSYNREEKDNEGEEASAYGTKMFRRKTHAKTRIILDALLLDLTVIIVDVDIVFFKDPEPYLGADFDIQIQSDVVEGNSGFYMARPSKACVKLHQKAWEIAETKGDKISNQKALDRTMETMSKRKELKMKTLSNELFPNGKVYFEDGKRMFYSDHPPKQEVLVHNNWIVSKAAKIYRFKEHLLWMVDGDDGYYTDVSRKYLVYSNSPSGTVEAEKEALKTAMLIGHLLRRTVILPTFSCAHCKYTSCKVASKQCSFNTHFKIASFDAVYENMYREHSFLSHPLVHQMIRHSPADQDVFFISPTDMKGVAPVNVTVLTPKDPKGPTEEEIVAWFAEDTSPVLQFHSLNAIYKNFRNTSYIQEKAFDTNTVYRNDS